MFQAEGEANNRHVAEFACRVPLIGMSLCHPLDVIAEECEECGCHPFDVTICHLFIAAET